jgi:selT/selW/selH-like putative selenoprotein
VAAGVAAELEEALGIKAKLVEERDGVFDIFVDDALIFSRSDAGRFPEPGEIVAMFNQ